MPDLSRAGRLVLALCVVAVDAASKAWAVRALSGAGTRWLWHPWLGLALYWNRGAISDLGAGHPGIVTAVGLVGTAALAVLLLAQRRAGPGVALMLGGGGGNLLSRLVSGAVPDFIRVYPGHGVFNLADVSLQVGVVWLVVDLLLASGHGRVSAGRARPAPDGRC